MQISKAKLVKIYEVVLIGANSYKTLYRSTDRSLCLEYKKKHTKTYKNKGKLSIIWADQTWVKV